MNEPKYAEGTTTFSPANPVTVGSRGTWTLVYTVGDTGLPLGTAIRISIPHGFSAPQSDNPDAPGFVTASLRSTEGAVRLTVEPSSGEAFDPDTGLDGAPGVFLFVEQAPLMPGDTLQLVYGAGEGQAFVSVYSGTVSFPVYVCNDGRAFPERFFRIREIPRIEVRSGEPERLEVTAPSAARSGDSVSLQVVARDRYGNRSAGWSGWLEVLPTSWVKIPAARRVEDSTGEGITLEVEITGPPVSEDPDSQESSASHVVTIQCRETERDLVATSNPIAIDEPAPYWGDLHACVSEGSSSHKELDFELAVGPQPTVKKTSFYFQTEPRSQGSASGRRIGFLRFSLPDAQSDKMMPSHLLEIYSCWGNREYWGAHRPDIRYDRHPERTAHAVLSQGIVAGFAAGSNSRFGVAGDARQAEAGRGYRGGLTGVYAESLTREALFTALRERRCYSTTGARIIMRVEMEGQEMGRLVEVRPEDANLIREREIKVHIHGTAVVEKIEVIRNNTEVCTYRGESANVSFSWTDRQELDRIALPRTMRGGSLTCYYFIRVTQADGEMAWSSPIWFLLRQSRGGSTEAVEGQEE